MWLQIAEYFKSNIRASSRSALTETYFCAVIFVLLFSSFCPVIPLLVPKRATCLFAFFATSAEVTFQSRNQLIWGWLPFNFYQIGKAKYKTLSIETSWGASRTKVKVSKIALIADFSTWTLRLNEPVAYSCLLKNAQLIEYCLRHLVQFCMKTLFRLFFHMSEKSLKDLILTRHNLIKMIEQQIASRLKSNSWQSNVGKMSWFRFSID